MSAASMLICAVSRSRISPTMMMSGSARIIARSPVAKVRVSAESYENWIARTRFGAIDGKTMVVVAPDEPTVAWLKKNSA